MFAASGGRVVLQGEKESRPTLALALIPGHALGHAGGEAQQTQRAMSLVLHRISGIGSPRGLSVSRAVYFGVFEIVLASSEFSRTGGS